MSKREPRGGEAGDEVDDAAEAFEVTPEAFVFEAGEAGSEDILEAEDEAVDAGSDSRSTFPRVDPSR